MKKEVTAPSTPQLRLHTMPGSTLKTNAYQNNLESGRIFFSSVPNGVFNLISSHTELKEFGRLHQVMQSNTKCNSHREEICASMLITQTHYSMYSNPKMPCAGCSS